jgi:hypothetical protein
VYGRIYAGSRCEGRFFGRRVNCERVPLLPAWAVREVLDDPRKIPYLLIWKSSWDGEIKEAVRVEYLGRTPYLPEADSIEVKRTDGSAVHLRVFKRPLPKNRGYGILLACPCCCSLRRALYGWQPGGEYMTSAQRSQWQCRPCAGLRYSSEGGALALRSRCAMLRPLSGISSLRPEPWFPYIFSSPADAAAAGFVTFNAIERSAVQKSWIGRTKAVNKS